MQKVVEFLNVNPVQYLATVGRDGKAKCRPFMFCCEKDGKLCFDKVLYVEGDKTLVGQPFVAGAKVNATIVKQGKEKKIHVLRYKAKSNLRVHHGHRQPYTALKIESIDVK